MKRTATNKSHLALLQQHLIIHFQGRSSSKLGSSSTPQQQQHFGKCSYHKSMIINQETNATTADKPQILSHLVVGGGSGFLGKQLLKQVLSPNSMKTKVPFAEDLLDISHVTVLSRKPELTRQILEKELPQSKWERKQTIQVHVKAWQDTKKPSSESSSKNKGSFLFNHQVCEEQSTFGGKKKVAAINLSGASIGKQNWSQKFKKEILESRTLTTLDLMNYLNGFGESASTFMGTSAVGYYPCTSEPSTTTPIYTEYNCESAAENPLGELTNAIENTIINSTNLENIKQRIIMRPGALIGKGGGVLQQMIVPYLGIALPIVFGSGLQPFSCIHLNDAANMYIHALYTNFNNLNESQSGKEPIIYNTVMPDMITFQQFAAKLNLETNIVPFPMIPLPYQVVQYLFGKERAQLLCEGQYVLPTRSMQENFQFQYPTLHSMIKEVTTFSPP